MLLVCYSFNVGMIFIPDILFQYFILIFKYDVGIDHPVLSHLYQISGLYHTYHIDQYRYPEILCFGTITAHRNHLYWE